MKAQVIILVSVVLAGCAEQPIAPVTDAGVVDSGFVVETDSGSEPDAGTPVVDAGSDAGRPDSSTPRDAGSDAGTDAGNPVMDAGPAPTPDAGPSDAGTPAPDSGPPATDAGPSGPPARPVGHAVDITGSRCALDEAGNFWCWGRWERPEVLEYLGTGYTDAWGSCAITPDGAVQCADFDLLVMQQVRDTDSSPLHLETVAEYSDWDHGCGTRHVPPPAGSGWATAEEVVCWSLGGSPVRQAGLSDGTYPLVTGIEAYGMRRSIQEVGIPGTLAQPFVAADPNDPARCVANATRMTCQNNTTGVSAGARWPSGDHRILGFGRLCAHTGSSTTCNPDDRSASTTVTDVGTFEDHALAWPVGTVVAGSEWQAVGLCTGGETITCYSDIWRATAVTAYTVEW